MKTLRALILPFILFASSHVWADAEAQNAKIAERIKPVGTVCAGAECGGAVVVASSAARSGEAVYNTACVACHGSGLLGAPKKGDTAAWDVRYKQGEKTLLDHSINGLNAMPPKGTCSNCSDDELLSAIKYMADR